MPVVGDVIDDHFQIESLLGEGAAGQVFKISLTRAWKQFPVMTHFALKYFKDSVFERESEDVVIKRRVREMRTGTTIDHPHLVKTYDTSEFHAGQFQRYLLMEFLEGEPLDAYVVRVGRLEIDDIYRILEHLSSGIQVLHRRGIVHRDIKSANTFMTTDGRVVLLDLGVVWDVTDATITGSQAFLGTLRYAAPEWLFREGFSERSDVYSLGAVALHLVTGQEIYHGIDLYSNLVLAVREKAPSVPVSDPDPRRHFLLKLIAIQLAKQPELRPELSEFIELVQSRDQSDIWQRLRHEQLLVLLPEGVNDPALVQKIEEAIPDDQLDAIVAGTDHEQLLSFPKVREQICIALGLGAEWHEYLALESDERVEWVEAKMKSFGESETLGAAIESRAYFADLVRSVEVSPTVQAKINPLLEFADVEYEDMWEQAKQDNPPG